MENLAEPPELSTAEESDSSLSSMSSEESLDSNRSFSENFIQYRKAIEMFVQNSVIDSLKLKTRVYFYFEDSNDIDQIASILQLLVDSGINELKMSGCRIAAGLKVLSKELVKTNIRKLVISKCDLWNSDFLYLMRSLKDSKITDLDISSNDLELNERWAKKIVRPLIGSHITTLNLSYCALQKGGDKILAEALLDTPIIHLNLFRCKFFFDGLMALFSNLPHTKITDLNLECVYFASNHPAIPPPPGYAMSQYSFMQIGDDNDLCKKLSSCLKHSKVSKLNLSDCKLDNWSLVLVFCQSLEESNIVDLTLAKNCFDDADLIFKEDNIRTRKTKITSLNISGNVLHNIWTADLLNFFGCSSVSTLNVSGCGCDDYFGRDVIKQLKPLEVTNLGLAQNKLSLQSLAEFASIVKDVKVETVDFSNNSLSAEALAILADCLRESTLKELDISNTFEHPLGATKAVALATLVEKTKGSRIECLKMSSNALSWNGTELIAVSLMNTTLTHLDLSTNQIGSAVGLFAGYLKSTAVTHLNLSDNRINDIGAEALANCLKETRIVDLNLYQNSIKFCGILAIAMCIKDTRLLSVKLSKIFEGSDEEYKGLADHIDDTFLMKFSLNKYRTVPSVDAVLWKNKASASKLIKFFKLEIMPFLQDSKFLFDHTTDFAVNFDAYFEKWLKFYKTILTRPAAMVVLGQDESIPFSSGEIAELLLEEFPRQLTQFIASQIEVDVAQLVRFLKNTDEMGLSKIVELLLLHRPIFMIDENLNILHPYAYKLLHKYKHPICHFETEPQKLINYFTANLDLEGASDVIEILTTFA